MTIGCGLLPELDGGIRTRRVLDLHAALAARKRPTTGAAITAPHSGHFAARVPAVLRSLLRLARLSQRSDRARAGTSAV